MVVHTVDKAVNYVPSKSDSGTQTVLAGVEPEQHRHGSIPGCVCGVHYIRYTTEEHITWQQCFHLVHGDDEQADNRQITTCTMIVCYTSWKVGKPETNIDDDEAKRGKSNKCTCNQETYLHQKNVSKVRVTRQTVLIVEQYITSTPRMHLSKANVSWCVYTLQSHSSRMYTPITLGSSNKSVL